MKTLDSRMLHCAALAALGCAASAGSGCFGGVRTAELHTPRYGHAAATSNCASGSVAPRAAHQNEVLQLAIRGKGGATQVQSWQANQTALIIVDMWHYHPCKTTTNRAGALVPRMNAVAAGLRKAGAHVIFAPTEAAESFDGWEQRESVLAQPLVPPPPYTPPVYNFSDSQGVMGVDDMCSSGGHGCTWNYGSMFQAPGLRIAATDFIVQGDTEPLEIYSLLTRLGIKNVLLAGIAENICVQAKTEGISTLRALGFNPVLARDLTDAQSHYDPDTFIANDKPWIHPDWGTVNVTRWVENGTPWTKPLATTVEAGLIAKAMGTYWTEGMDEPIEPVLHAPWGTQLRPHIFDQLQFNLSSPDVVRDFANGQPVTLSTGCNTGRTLGCDQPYDIRYTLDGTTPTPNSLNYTRPFLVKSTTVVKAAGFARATGAKLFAESQSVLVVRPETVCVVSEKAGGAARYCIPGVWSGFRCSCPSVDESTSQQQGAEALVDISTAPILWNYGDDPSYRVFPKINTSWTGTGLHYRMKGYATGLGLKAPMHLNYNMTQLRVTAPGITHFVAAAGIDDGCDHGGASTPPYNCHDIAEWQHTIVQVYVDGGLAAESPVLQAETLEWVFNVPIPAGTELLRIVARPIADTGNPGITAPEAMQPMVQQNAYDYIDLSGGFFGDKRTAIPVETAKSLYTPSGCFGGPGHTTKHNLARYGHAAEAATCGTTTSPRDSSTSAVLELISRGKDGATTRLHWQGNETALIIIDMWNYHPCKTVTNRVGALIPRQNAVAAALRKAGGHVIFAPTDATESFVGWEQRESVLAQPLLSVPKSHVPPQYNYSDTMNIVGFDDECSSSGHGCTWNYGEFFQAPALRIATTDFIVAGDSNPAEIFSLLKRLEVKNVIVAGVAENICVLGKAQGVPSLKSLGFNPVLARDLTDAQSHYDPDTFIANDKPWIHPDWGTVNVTRWVENGTPWTKPLATTVEAGLIAKAMGTYWTEGMDEPIEPVLHAPWGTQLRPHIFDLQKYTASGPVTKQGAKLPSATHDFTNGQPVTLSTGCNTGRTLGCDQPYDIRYTLDGTTPTPNSLNYTRPFLVKSTTVVKAAGFARATGAKLFAESQSVLVVRPETVCVVSEKAGGAARYCIPGVWTGWPALSSCTCPSNLAEALVDLAVAPILWGYGDDPSYRQRPRVNESWSGTGLHYRMKGYATGLGLKAPMHLNYNMTQLRVTAPGITHFVAAAGIDDGCDHGGASTPPYNCNGIASWQNTIVQVYVDGGLAAESPVLQAETLEWVFNVPIPAGTELLRIVARPIADTGNPGITAPEAMQHAAQPSMQQNAYDFVDLVGGFYG